MIYVEHVELCQARCMCSPEGGHCCLSTWWNLSRMWRNMPHPSPWVPSWCLVSPERGSVPPMQTQQAFSEHSTRHYISCLDSLLPGKNFSFLLPLASATLESGDRFLLEIEKGDFLGTKNETLLLSIFPCSDSNIFSFLLFSMFGMAYLICNRNEGYPLLGR